MSRHRLAVALLAPPAEAAAIDVLRRALGVAEPFHVAPHVTLVPPVNVAAADMAAAFDVLARVARACHPIELEIGPAATFAPETPTVHLEVAGAHLDELRSMRGDLRAGPFDRPDVWPFHPHVTLLENAPVEVMDAAILSLSGLRQGWPVRSLHLLEQRRRPPEHHAHGQAYWEPVREEPLGGPAVVGRGGVELALRTLGMVDEAVGNLCWVPTAGPAMSAGAPRPLVVSAATPRPLDRLVGAAVGTVSTGPAARLDRVVVDEPHRHTGVGAQVLAAWTAAAAAAGAEIVVADGIHPFLERRGFTAVGDTAVRILVANSGESVG